MLPPSEDLNFTDLAPVEIGPIPIWGKQYVLHEASAEAARQYRNATVKGGRWDADTRTSTPGQVGDAEPLLVSLCLFELYTVKAVNGVPVERSRPVPLSEVLKWPYRVVRPLFDKAVAISHLREEKEEPKKQTSMWEEAGEDYAKSRDNGDAEEIGPDPTTATQVTSLSNPGPNELRVSGSPTSASPTN